MLSAPRLTLSCRKQSRFLGSDRATTKVSLPPFRNLRAIVVLMVVIALLVAAAFVVGLTLGRAKQLPDTSTIVVPARVQVENRTVNSRTPLQGVVAAGKSEQVVPSPPSGTSNAVVQKHYVSAGSSVRSGTLIAIVSNRPIIVLKTRVGFFRQMHVNDSGLDVSALQAALNAARISTQMTGNFDWQTQTSLMRLYAASGLEAPGKAAQTYFDPGEIAVISTKTAVVGSMAPVGSVVSARNPLATLELGAPYVRSRVGVGEKNTYPVGAEVSVTGPEGLVLNGRVRTVGTFQSATASTSISGYDLQISVSTKDAVALPEPSTPVTLTANGAEGTALAVPLIALSQEGGEFYVRPAAETSQRPSRKVVVRVLRQSDGWAAIAPTRLLQPGTELLVY